MNWICWIFGHRYDPDAAEYYRIYYCERCCQEEPDLRLGWLEWLSVKWRFWYERTRDRWRRWYRCRDCGRHFGRHTPGCEDVPF